MHRAALGTIGAGDGYQFGLNFDQTILDIDEVSDDGDERVRAKIRIDGDIDFNAGYGVEVHIDPPNLNFLDADFDLLPSLRVSRRRSASPSGHDSTSPVMRTPR